MRLLGVEGAGLPVMPWQMTLVFLIDPEWTFGYVLPFTARDDLLRGVVRQIVGRR